MHRYKGRYIDMCESRTSSLTVCSLGLTPRLPNCFLGLILHPSEMHRYKGRYIDV